MRLYSTTAPGRLNPLLRCALVGGRGRALQYSDDAAAQIVATMRKWIDSGKAQPTIRYSLLGTATLLRVDFEVESEARAFAQAFGGTVPR